MNALRPKRYRLSKSSLLSLALLLLVSIACKNPEGREWDNAFPDRSGALDVDGPPRQRAGDRYLDRRTAPEPINEEKAKENKEKERAGDPKKDGS